MDQWNSKSMRATRVCPLWATDRPDVGHRIEMMSLRWTISTTRLICVHTAPIDPTTDDELITVVTYR
jgi:hypothetical protein